MNPLVALIVSQPGMGERLLAQHVDDGHGRCRVCTPGAQAAHHRWPCSIYGAAAEAEVVRARNEADQRPPA